jgi:uncharacterized membrane protein
VELRNFHIPSLLVLAAALVYGTTLLGVEPVGSDIRREFLDSKLAFANGWQLATLPEQSNTSIIVGLLAPALAHIWDMATVYKWILPMFLIAVPIVLYQVFKAQIGNNKAWYAAMFFMIVPVYNLEIAQIAKMMAAEFFFALLILAMVSKLKPYQKSFAMTLTLLLTILSHYTVGLAALVYLLGILIVRVVTGKLKWQLLGQRRIPVLIMAVVLLIGLVTGYAYYSYADNGEIVQTIMGVGTAYSGITVQRIQEGAIENNQIYLNSQPPLVRTGIGFDFFEVNAWGKAFRVVQYLTQLAIVVGAVWLLFKHRQYNFSAEFVAGIGCSFLLLACCVFIPSFSSTINMTRFYHLSLFFLAPMFVIGFDFLKKRT